MAGRIQQGIVIPDKPQGPQLQINLPKRTKTTSEQLATSIMMMITINVIWLARVINKELHQTSAREHGK